MTEITILVRQRQRRRQQNTPLLACPTSGHTRGNEYEAQAALLGVLILITGHIEVPADDNYKFHITTDGQALLRIHNATVIDAGFTPPKNSSSASIKLKAGKHPFRLYRKDSGENFSLKREIHPKEVLSTIPAKMLSH